METTKSLNLSGILTSLDFRKAFDSLEWPFIMKTLDYFNFGCGIKRWVNTLYSNIESTVINNGFRTNWFKLSKGVRQGCPLSPYLFILSAEILSNKIRQDPNITGIKIYGNEIKLSQFADDTTLFNADLASLERALKLTNDFGKIAGLSLNVKKTKAIWLGKWANNKNKPLNLKWLHSPVKILGIHFSYDEKRNNELNFIHKIQKLQTKLDMWSSRDLTIFGRAMILKTLGLSQLVYSVSNLLVPQGIADAVKTKSFKFLWRNKKDKIKRSGLYQEPDRVSIAKQTDDFNKSFFISNDNIFPLSEAVQINLGKARSRDFYKLLNVKTHNDDHTGPLRWSQNLSINSDTWSKIFKSLRSICKDTKLKEFQFKFTHRIIETNKELFRFGIRPDDECLYCGDKDSIEHTFIECPFTKTFVQRVVQWFNQTNICQIFPTTEEVLFGYFSSIWDARIKKKFNYTTLAMRQYIYANKTNSKAISVHEFIDKLLVKYNLENIY